MYTSLIRPTPTERQRLQRQLQFLQEQEQAQQQVPAEIPITAKPHKIQTLIAQISHLKKRLLEQQELLSNPPPPFLSHSSSYQGPHASIPELERRLEQVKQQYRQIFRQRFELVKNTNISKYQEPYLKQFEKLSYIKKAYFPFLADKQSTLIGFADTEDFSYGKFQQERFQREKQQQKILQMDIQVLEQEIAKLQQS